MKKLQHRIDDIQWIPHPIAPRVTVKPLVTKKDDEVDVTCMLVMVPKGTEVPEHVHEDQDDILYPLKGKAVMWMEGSGSFAMEPGMMVRVPKGTSHKISDVKEDLLLYDVFWPALM